MSSVKEIYDELKVLRWYGYNVNLEEKCVFVGAFVIEKVGNVYASSETLCTGETNVHTFATLKAVKEFLICSYLNRLLPEYVLEQATPYVICGAVTVGAAAILPPVAVITLYALAKGVAGGSVEL